MAAVPRVWRLMKLVVRAGPADYAIAPAVYVN